MVLCGTVNAALAAEFLDPDQAFRLRAELSSSKTILLNWEIAKGYKLYQDKVKATAEGGGAKLQNPVMPKAILYTEKTKKEKLDI